MNNSMKPMSIVMIVIAIITFLFVDLPVALGNIRDWIGNDSENTACLSYLHPSLDIPTASTLNQNVPEYGALYFNNGSFTGYHINGQLITGTSPWPDGTFFQGNWTRGGDSIRTGVETRADGTVRIGRPCEDSIRTGVETSTDGTVRTGRFEASTGLFLD